MHVNFYIFVIYILILIFDSEIMLVIDGCMRGKSRLKKYYGKMIRQNMTHSTYRKHDSRYILSCEGHRLRWKISSNKALCCLSSYASNCNITKRVTCPSMFIIICCFLYFYY